MADARYFRVSPKLWQEQSWDDDTRLLALYVLTCDHRTTEGLFRLPKQYILADLDWSSQRLAQPFEQLCADGFMDYDEDAKVLLITKALKYQSPSNPNGVVSALRVLEMVPATRLDSVFCELTQRYSERLAEALPERFTERLDEPPAPTPAPKGGSRKRAHQLPDDWSPSDELLAEQRTKHPNVNLERELEKFRNHWRSKGETRKDWSATWRNWVIKAEEFKRGSPGAVQPPERDANYADGWSRKATG